MGFGGFFSPDFEKIKSEKSARFASHIVVGSQQYRRLLSFFYFRNSLIANLFFHIITQSQFFLKTVDWECYIMNFENILRQFSGFLKTVIFSSNVTLFS